MCKRRRRPQKHDLNFQFLPFLCTLFVHIMKGLAFNAPNLSKNMVFWSCTFNENPPCLKLCHVFITDFNHPLIFNLYHSFSLRLTRRANDDNNNVVSGEDDPAAVRSLPVGEREDALRAMFSKLKIVELKQLLSAKPQASKTGKKMDLIDRYDCFLCFFFMRAVT